MRIPSLCLAAALAAASAAESAPLPAGLFASQPHGEAIGVGGARVAPTPGAEITMRGIVGGRTRPFIDGRAIFTVMDRSLRCETACGTGWSGCGNPPEALRGGVATVQVAGADGRPIAASLAGIGGLAPGADVIVRGTVAAGSTTQALIVNAAAIHVAAAR